MKFNFKKMDINNRKMTNHPPAVDRTAVGGKFYTTSKAS